PEGHPVMNHIRLSAVKPVPDGFTLDNHYISRGFRGLVGIHPAATSWTNKITFNPNGTFENSDMMIGSLSANIPDLSTHGAAGSESGGMYLIDGNTITLSYK